jgi:predicted phosphodiesterase
VWGNVDGSELRGALPEVATVELAGVQVLVAHHLSAGWSAAESMTASGADRLLVAYGHSHKPSVTTRGGVLLVNPGSAGPRRFRLPVAVAIVDIAAATLDAVIIELKI